MPRPAKKQPKRAHRWQKRQSASEMNHEYDLATLPRTIRTPDGLYWSTLNGQPHGRHQSPIGRALSAGDLAVIRRVLGLGWEPPRSR